MAELQVHCKLVPKTKSEKMKSHSHRLSSKCGALMKEQRGRIYLVRRCATMLLCWYIHGDHD